MTEDFDGYRKWLGITNKKRLPTHYELLAISLDEDDPEVIHAAAEQRRRFVESKRGDGHDGIVTEILYRINEAETTLLDNEMRRGYDRQLDLFVNRQKERQIDPLVPHSRIRSRPGPTVGEGTGFVSTFAGILGVFCVAMVVMAWFSFQLPWFEAADEIPESVTVAVEPVAPEPNRKKIAGAKDKESEKEGPTAIQQQVEKLKVSSDRSEANKNGMLPAPVLYLPCDTAVATIPSRPTFKRKRERYVVGKIGQAIAYDGNDYTEVNASLPLGNAPRTLAVWLRNERGPVGHNVHAITQGTVESAKPFGIMEAGEKWRFFDFNGGLDSGIRVDRQWHHHAVTFNGVTIRYFFDGKQVGSIDRKLQTDAGGLKLGGVGDVSNNFVGIMDELYVFDVPLAEDQIRQLMDKMEVTSLRLSSDSASPSPSTSGNAMTVDALVKTAKSSKKNQKGEVIELDLSNVKLGDPEIAALGQIVSLQRLTAPKSGLSDDHISRLTNLKNLTSLGLWQTRISNEGLKTIGQFTNLSYLSVEGIGRVTNNGVAHLSDCRKLSWLGLSHTGVSDDGMRYLTKLPLTRIDLEKTAIGDDGLNHLAKISTLRTLTLTKTKVTDAGVAKLKRSLPNCKVIR